MSGHEVHDTTPEPLSLAWRLERIRVGDLAMAEARKTGLAGDLTGTMIHVMTAQAHYAAANVRASEPRPIRHGCPACEARAPGTVVIGGSDGVHDRPRRPGA
jgi:hypothetical protein